MVKRINLALQGGGAHGAFTWGVLDRLLEDEEIEVAAITGTSAGALNGAAFKSGMVQGGRAGARAALERLWQQMGAVGDMRFSHWLMPGDALALAGVLDAAMAFSPLESMSQMFSPYHYGPFYQNPLRDVVDQLSLDDVCCDEGPELFICATAVRTGKIRVFEAAEISTDAILASACLPDLFQAVEIEDPKTGRVEPYWDGGFTGNPALFPLFQDKLPGDVVIININPLEREEIPKTPQQIRNRVNEISFNSSLLRELRAIHFVQRLLAEGRLEQGQMKQLRIHMIAEDDLMTQLSVATKLLPVPQILMRLKQAGRDAAERFLQKDRAAIGRYSSVDLPAMFG